MLKDAFTAWFKNTETTLVPDGVTIVPKSSNLIYIRNQIKDYKKNILEQIIEMLISKFEARDHAIRLNKNSGYTVNPWKIETKYKQKHQLNQVVQSDSVATAARKFRADGKPPTNNPRCNNCGSKRHLCSERTK